jgi:hypothetical protein
MFSVKRIFAFLVVLIMISSISISVSATTFDDFIGVPIHWGYATVKYNQSEDLDGIWLSLGDDAATMWDTASTEITCSQVDFSVSKLDFCTADNYDFDAGVVGESNIYDSDGTNLNGDPISSFNSNGTVTYASIFMNPDPPNSLTTTQKKGVLGHEFGHCMGLWHPSSSTQNSIMQQGSSNPYWKTTPQTYDKNDISKIY